MSEPTTSEEKEKQYQKDYYERVTKPRRHAKKSLKARQSAIGTGRKGIHVYMLENEHRMLEEITEELGMSNSYFMVQAMKNEIERIRKKALTH